MKKDLAHNVIYLIWFAVVIAAGYGWISNLVTVWNSDFTVITGELVVRAIGIFAFPIGAIAGYF